MDLLARLWRHLPEVFGLAAVLWAQLQLGRWLMECGTARRYRALRYLLGVLTFLVAVWATFGVAATLPSAYRLLPSSRTLFWLRGGALAWCFASVGAFLILSLCRSVPQFRSERRGFIRATGSALVAAPFAAVGFGIVQRKDFRVREVQVPIAHLPKDLDGLRIAHLSDIHLSPFLSEQELARAVAMANELRPHLAVVTGDLITSPGDPLDACLRQLARLRAEAGTLACLGNHELFARVGDEATWKGAKLGIKFLRNESRTLQFGSATLNVLGVDYQQLGSAYLTGGEQWIAPGATNILLSHNPDVFNVAAAQGWDLTLAGHTHGGQVNVEILHQSLNPARFYTPYVYGLYRKGRSSIWVTRGIGTVGVPARLGAPPEVALVRLCAT